MSRETKAFAYLMLFYVAITIGIFAIGTAEQVSHLLFGMGFGAMPMAIYYEYIRGDD